MRAKTMTDKSEWTKWWWLGFFDVPTWRRARIALLLAGPVAGIVVLLVTDAILEWFGVERHVAAALAAFICIGPGFLWARPIVGGLYPALLRQGDENSEKRLGGPFSNSN
jgi:hypothetical protein